MARPPNRIPPPPGQLRPDSLFVPPDDPCVPSDPDQFERVCPPPGGENGWNAEDWKFVLSADFSGLDFSGCGNEAECLESLAAYPWADINFVSPSAEAIGVPCVVTSDTPWPSGQQPNWTANFQLTRFNGPPINDIRISFVSDIGENPDVGLPAMWFSPNSDDRFSTQDYPDWTWGTASPPFSFFPVTWTQSVRCGSSSCVTGLAIFTLELVPVGVDCPEPRDPCETMGAFCDPREDLPDIPDWCWRERLPDGTCPPIPGVPDRMRFDPFLAVEDLPAYDVVAGNRYYLSQELPGDAGSRLIARPFLAAGLPGLVEGMRYWRFASQCGECDCADDCDTPDFTYPNPCPGSVCCLFGSNKVLMPSSTSCTNAGGTVVSDSTCGQETPTSAAGACCTSSGCEQLTQEMCDLHGGLWVGGSCTGACP
jgi:hypothetical protein